MTYEREYKLADKMQKQFRERGQAVRGMQASSTSELIRRAEMGYDPHVNCAEQAFRESYSRRQTQQGARTQNRGVHAEAVQSRNGYAKTNEKHETKRTAERSGRYASHTQAAAQGRFAGAQTRDHAKQDDFEPAVEIKVKQKTFPPFFIAMLLIGTLMVMCLVFSISQVYQTTNQIERLEAELETLRGEADDLQLRLEEKNDVRKIEEIATAELGMVKEDSLQRRYVSLSDGEYIELVGNGEETDESTGGVMLSSIFSSLGQFFERFR